MSNERPIKSCENYFARVPYALFDAHDEGQLTPIMFVIMIWLYRWADWKTGTIRNCSAERLHRTLTEGRDKRLSGNENLPSLRTIQRALQGLVEAGWLTSDYIRGSKRPYCVRITNYVCVADGDAERKVVNPKETKGWMDTAINQGANPDADKTLTRRGEDAEKAANTIDSSENLPEKFPDSTERNVVDIGGAPKANPSGQTKTSGKENDQGISVLCDDEIYREYQAVYDRLKRADEYDHVPEFQMPTAKQRKDAADLYRAVGRDAALSQWEAFLVNDNHDRPESEWQPDDPYDPGCVKGRWVNGTNQRTWLLHDFVVKYGTTVGTR